MAQRLPPRRLPGKVLIAAALVWIASALCFVTIFISSEMTRQRRDFRIQSEAAYDLVEQRLDQNDAVMAGIETLLHTFPGLDPQGLRDYARQMLARYPHIYMVEMQPRVEFAQLQTFQRWARQNIDPEFVVKDVSHGAERGWHPVPARPVYYPITFMEPLPKEARPVLGLDVYAENKFRSAIDEAVSTGIPSVSAPFELFNGDRAYLIFKAIYVREPGQDDLPTRALLATRMVSMLIRTDKLISKAELQSPAISLRLYARGFGDNDAKAQIERIDAPARQRWETAFFPTLIFSKLTSNRSQPFVFETRRQLGPGVLPLIPSVVTVITTFVITLLALILYRQRRTNRIVQWEGDRRLFEERERALVIVESIADAVVTMDEHGVVVYANPVSERLLDRVQEAMLGQRIDDLIVLNHDLAQTMPVNPFWETLTQAREVSLPDNCFIWGAHGEKRLLEGTISPLFNQEGVLTGAVAALRDVGPVRKRAFAALQASEQRLQARQEALAHAARIHSMGELAAGMAHELNQPLAAILSYNQACVRLLRESELDLAAIERAMLATTDQAKRAADIIIRLRAFISKRPVHVVTLDMKQVLQNVLVLSEPWLRQSETKVELVSEWNLPAVRADGVQIEQVALNLIHNAVEAMLSKPIDQRTLWLKLEYEDGMVVLRVRDTGIGVSASVRETLFHPFATSKENGMGLGLTICASIAETYGGRVVENEAILEGAEFLLILPAWLRRN
jgi:PAS domain S-box-containing protein